MSQPTDIPQKRVLIVDDSKFVRTTFNRVVSASFAVREEADGEAGWQAIRGDSSIVMVFSDLDMPKLDGYGLIGRIRKSEEARIRELPVVVISGSQDEASKRRARDAGANDFISKSADAPEVLSRIDNLLRLVKAKEELQASQQALERTATHDPLTGTFTPHYLITEGRKRYSYARRHGGQLSVMALRIESHAEVAQKVGKDVADQLLVRITRLIAGMLRAEDSIGRTADATFVVISAGTGAPQVLAFARRLYEQLENAQVSYGKQLLKIHANFGVASLGIDTANSIEELIKLALQRLQKAVSPKAKPIPGEDDDALVKPTILPGEVERALQVLERLDAERLGEATNEILRRLLPFLHAAFKRMQVGFPVEKVAKMLQRKQKEVLPL